jgi:spermidine/putrescine transport system permease protein
LSSQPAGRKGLIPYLLTFPGVLWLIAFFAIPLATMWSVSLQDGSLERGFTFAWNWRTYVDGLSMYQTQIVRSLIYGLIVTGATLLIGYPVAYWIAFRGGRRKNVYLLMLLLPFFTPFLIRTLSWKFVLADQGILLGPLKSAGLIGEDVRLLATPVAVICGLIYNFLPFMTLPLYVALERIDRSALDAAADLYSSPRSAFWRVTLPLSLPGVFAGSLLTFIPSVGDFIDAELLGNPNTTMIGNVIQRLFRNFQYPEGAALSILLMLGILVGVFVYARLLGTEDLTGR